MQNIKIHRRNMLKEILKIEMKDKITEEKKKKKKNGKKFQPQ